MNGKFVLLIEDDDRVLELNKVMLAEEGFEAEAAMTLAEARAILKRRRADIIVLDRGMPDGEGLDLLRELRSRGNNVPVLVLTGHGKDKEVEQGFDAGCNDYLAKPYTFGVLHKRLLRLLQSAEQMPETITKGSITFNPTAAIAYINGEDMTLTQKEFALLLIFTQHENKTLSAEYLYEKVWGQDMAGNNDAIKKAVTRLRTKLEDSDFIIITKRGEGYCFERA